jgi:hypothetical protein
VSTDPFGANSAVGVELPAPPPDIMGANWPIYTARVGLGHRALAVVDGDVVIWFWIGTHADYGERLRAL